MRIGICTSVENIQKVQKIGFDYIETSVVAIASMDENEFAKTQTAASKSEIYYEAFNCMFPGDMMLTGPKRDMDSIKAYIDNVFPRLSALGGRIVVLGSGQSRKIPDNLDCIEAYEQFAQTVLLIGEKCEEYDLTLALEPLNKGETNLINSVEEGLELVNKINNENIRLLADYYHMLKEGEDTKIIEQGKGMIVHTHIASGSRNIPLDINEHDYESFFSALRSIGYQGGVSIEAGIKAFDEKVDTCLEILRELASGTSD